MDTKNKKKITKVIANLLSLSRIIIGALLFTVANAEGLIVAAIVAAMGMATDFIDGHIARKYNVQTNIGKLLDPIGDKVIILISLILIIMNMETTIMKIITMLPIAMEGTIFVQQFMNLRKNIVLNPTRVGKVKEVFIGAFLTSTLIELGISNNEIVENLFKFFSGSLFFVSVGLETFTIKSYHNQAKEQLQDHLLEEDLEGIYYQKESLKMQKKELLKLKKSELITKHKAEKTELKNLPLTTNERLDRHIASRNGLLKFLKIWAHGFTDTEFFKDNASVPVLSLIKQVSKLSVGKDDNLQH